MLSGAFCSKAALRAPTPTAIPSKLSRDKYTLGQVKKVGGDVWQIPARIQYSGKDITLPILLPIRWAGDTPVVTVDDLPMPGFSWHTSRPA